MYRSCMHNSSLTILPLVWLASCPSYCPVEEFGVCQKGQRHGRGQPGFRFRKCIKCRARAKRYREQVEAEQQPPNKRPRTDGSQWDDIPRADLPCPVMESGGFCSSGNCKKMHWCSVRSGHTAPLPASSYGLIGKSGLGSAGLGLLLPT